MKLNKRVGLSRYIAPHASYGWYVKNIATYALLAGLVIGMGMWFYQQQMLKTIGFDDPVALQQQAATMLVHSVTVSAIATSIYFLIVAACFFHRVAGPVFRLKRHMLEVLNDQSVSKLQVRQSDQLLDVIDVYNQLLVKVGVIDEPADQSSAAEQFSQSA